MEREPQDHLDGGERTRFDVMAPPTNRSDGRSPLLAWTLANAAGMALGFLTFLELLNLLAFGLDFSLHWDSEAVGRLEDPMRMLRIGLPTGLPLAGAVLTLCQAWVLRHFLGSVWPWVLTGPAGFAVVLLFVWPLSEIGVWGSIPGPVEPFAIVGVGLGVTGLLQWLFLRRRGIEATRWLLLWIAGLPLGMVLFMGVATLIMRVLTWPLEVALIGGLVGGTAAALSGKPLFRAISLGASSS